MSDGDGLKDEMRRYYREVERETLRKYRLAIAAVFAASLLAGMAFGLALNDHAQSVADRFGVDLTHED